MAINFPSNPTDAQEVTEGNVTYVYNATKGYWESTEDSSGASTTVYANMTALIAATGMSNGDQAFVTGNNNLYIYSGSGWYKIATVQNDSPSAITGVSGTYALAIDGTATTITAVSTDPEGFPLTWSYSTSGLGSIATISQSDNVFTITPSTTEADAGTFNLTINATDGVNGAVSTSTNLTLEFIVIVANSRYTTLLATADGTSDNNNITDASTNNHTITVNGDAHAGTFSPYRSGGYSTYFDGSSDNLSLTANSGFNLDSNFTIECWFNPSSITLDSQNPSILKIGTTQLYLNVSNNYVGFYHSTNDVVKSSNSSITENQWYHVSVTRSGSVLTLFLDGVSVDTRNDSTGTYGASTGAVDIGTYSGTGGDFHGYISDLRIVKGTAITPPSGGPTERLQAVTNTSLLTCHLPYIADGSTNSHSITVNGNVSTKPFSPYDYIEYSATDHGGSVYHGGTAGYTDYIEGNYTAIGTNDFTLQFWVYPKTSSDIYAGYFSSKKSTTITGFTVAKDTIDFGTNTSSGAAFGNPNIREEAWSHVAVVRSGDNSTAYVNGKSIGTISGTGSYNIASDRFWTMQRYGYNQGGGWPGKGYISDLKISQSVDYTADFTPPTSPLSSSGADIHIKGTDASIVDKAQGSNLNLVGNTTGSTTQVKFADTKSMYFDGTGDYLSTLSSDLLRMGTGNFTVECWVNKSLANHRGIWQISSTVGGLQSTNYGQTLALGFQVGVWQIYAGGGSAGINGPSFSLSTNTWYHTAVVRNSGTTKLYIDGTEEISISDSHDYTGTYMVIGGYYSTSYLHHGYIQDLRVTKGLARYTANFTPPTASLEG